jgi:hypothetical protein
MLRPLHAEDRTVKVVIFLFFECTFLVLYECHGLPHCSNRYKHVYFPEPFMGFMGANEWVKSHPVIFKDSSYCPNMFDIVVRGPILIHFCLTSLF